MPSTPTTASLAARLACAMIAFRGSAIAGDAWRLSSQTWTNLLGGGVVYSPYGYDEQGLRTLRRDFNGPDSSGQEVSRTVWEYDALDRPVREVLFSLSDTLAIVSRTFDGAGRPVLESTWGPGGKLRFRDSTAYDAQGRRRSVSRHAADGTLVSRTEWTPDESGLLVADTLWQHEGSGLVALVARTTAWSDGVVQSTQEWSRASSAASWKPTSRTEMEYAEGRLAAVTNLDGDGAGRVLTDSTAYDYDADGNRRRETSFNQDRDASTRIDYLWIRRMTVPVIRTDLQGQELLSVHQGRIHIRSGDGALAVRLLDARGRVVQAWNGRIDRDLELPVALVPGRYHVVAELPRGRATCSFASLP